MAAEPGHEQSQPGEFVTTHVRDYSAFTKLLKWGAIVSFITAMVVLVVIGN